MRLPPRKTKIRRNGDGMGKHRSFRCSVEKVVFVLCWEDQSVTANSNVYLSSKGTPNLQSFAVSGENGQPYISLIKIMKYLDVDDLIFLCFLTRIKTGFSDLIQIVSNGFSSN